MTETDFRALCAELEDAYTWCIEEYMTAPAEEDTLIQRARAALAQPEPVALTRPECFGFAMSFLGDPEETEVRRYVEALEARAAIQPVPVSERLPQAEDCAPWPDEPDATNWCWAAKCVSGGWEWTQLSMLRLGSDTLGRIIAGGGWTH